MATTDEDSRIRARKKSRSLLYSFRLDAAAYVLVNALLIGIWYFGRHGFPWFVFVLGGWGIGLAYHFDVAYCTLGRDWVGRETQKILDQDK
jgi:2TM domain